MTLDVYADLFDEDLDGVADDWAPRSDLLRTHCGAGQDHESYRQDVLAGIIGGAKGIRTPDLLDANETRYQLRHSP